MHASEFASTPLSALDVLIVDCQTTGATPQLGSVLELGWCLVRGGQSSEEARAHWVALPEGERVSAQVRALTGFEDSMRVDALPAEQAWQELRACMGLRPAMPTAIHFARFELSFLRSWAERFEPGVVFPFDAVCVHAIACRLFPNLPRRNLRALAGFLGHGLHLERRALGHVLATAFIWRKLAAELGERGVGSWPELQAWLAARPGSVPPRKRSYPIEKTRYRTLPDQPGVYRMLRSNGDVLYVGKATSLKKRVSSHFSKQRGATERALEMLTQVSDVQFTETASALEAALLETEQIKALDPPYNVQLVRGERGAWFASSDFESASAAPDERHRRGPMPSRFSLRPLRAVMELLGSAEQSPSRRAGAVGAAPIWAPDEATFRAGWALFAERHAASRAAEMEPRRRTLTIARKLLLTSAEASELALDEPVETAPFAWDPERVCRHIERSVAAAYQVYRRASWLCLLSESVVYFREPGGEVGRVLSLHAGNVVDARDATGRELETPRQRSSSEARRLVFDAGSYDKLRILTTELKRIQRDGGDVAVRLSRTRLLDGPRLLAILSLV